MPMQISETVYEIQYLIFIPKIANFLLNTTHFRILSFKALFLMFNFVLLKKDGEILLNNTSKHEFCFAMGHPSPQNFPKSFMEDP